MSTSFSAPASRLLPIDVPLPKGVPLSDGAYLVDLPSLDLVSQFWDTHRKELPCVASGLLTGDTISTCLHPWEWIFAPSEASAVRWASRWYETGIEPIWLPAIAESFADDFFNSGINEVLRKRQSIDMEPREYRPNEGRWIALNLYPHISPTEVFSFHYADRFDSLWDPQADIQQVHVDLQTLAYESWHDIPGDKEPFALFGHWDMDFWLETQCEQRMTRIDHYGPNWWSSQAFCRSSQTLTQK